MTSIIKLHTRTQQIRTQRERILYASRDDHIIQLRASNHIIGEYSPIAANAAAKILKKSPILAVLHLKKEPISGGVFTLKLYKVDCAIVRQCRSYSEFSA